MVCQPVLSVMEIIVDISSGFRFHGQYWLEYHPVLSVVDNIGWYINWFCLSRK